MKHILPVLFIALALVRSQAQAPYPDCTNLLVDSVYISGADLRVVLSNTCSNCASGINGAIYLEMAVVRRSNPTDTFSHSDCYCHMSPNNNGQLAYILPAPVTSLPPLSDIRVSLYSLCLDIPFKSVTSVKALDEKKADAYYQRGNKRIVIAHAGRANYTLFDNMGRVIAKGLVEGGKYQIDTQSLLSGLYYVELVEEQKRTVKKVFVQ
jgi:hypothetical protein